MSVRALSHKLPDYPALLKARLILLAPAHFADTCLNSVDVH
jgi:hypothetical protein